MEKGLITIIYAKPITTDLITVLFKLGDVYYKWNTSCWRSGKNPIPYSNAGDTYDVSFRVIDGKEGDLNVMVTNVKIMK